MKNSEINIRDPFVLVHDGKYYMYGTRAENFGQNVMGFDVYISTDLENWSEPKEVYNSSKYNYEKGVFWAPEVHEYNGSFYMFATFTKPNGLRGTYVLSCKTPDGEFKPHSDGAITPWEWECLDGTLYVENGIPYCVFCHEHTQILNGTICYIQLKDDLSGGVGDVKELFSAESFLGRKATERQHNITDGPFIYKTTKNDLLMIWSTVNNRYYQCVAKSDNGKLDGNWSHLKPLFDDDGGHGMIFKDLEGKLKLTLHSPNKSNYERPVFFNIRETEESIEII